MKHECTKPVKSGALKTVRRVDRGILVPVNTLRSARDLARATVIGQIKEVARRHVATEGAPALSLRAVARQLGLVSSAIYRYFPSRDELLTALIVDAYDDLGAHTEAVALATTGEAALERWSQLCRSIRSWTLEHPHEYALLYGSPVPGYRAPRTTIAPATRVVLAMAGVVCDAWARHEITTPRADDASEVAASGPVADDAARVAAALGLDAPTEVVARMLLAWTQLFGMLSFELFGHLVGSVDDNAAFFDYAAAAMGRFVGLA